MLKKSYILMICAIFFSQAGISSAYEKKITLASLDWEPYVGESLSNNGYVAEVVEQAFMAVGYDKKDIVIKFVPWARAVKLGINGEYDAIVPEYLMPEREKHFNFSSPFPGGPVGFYKKKSLNLKYKDFDDLAQQFQKAHWKIGVVNEYVNTVEFDENPNITKIKEYAVSDELNVRKLIGDRFNMIFIDQNVANYIVNKLPDSERIHRDFEFVEPPLENKDFYICFSRKSPFHKEKMADFNRGYRILEEKGIVESIMKRHNLKYYSIKQKTKDTLSKQK
ncbi:MAG: transporter substrate-binding domain-containing protein [Rhodoferax sp.]|nr:transporter substrate-binding domain-containing protein [Rhodoferax sp.]